MILTHALVSLWLLSASNSDEPQLPNVNVQLANEGGTVDGETTGATKKSHTKTSKVSQKKAKTRPSGPPPRRLVPACPGNYPVGGVDALCTQAIAPCATAEAGSYRAWLFEQAPVTTKTGVDLRWRIIDSYCVGSGEPERAGTPVLSVREFRRLPLPAGDMHIQPGSGPVLINIPTNVYVRAEPIRLHTRVVGVDVEVEATPSSFTWTFGDGGTLVTQDRGDPYPDMRTTHTYLHPGKWPVTLTTIYTGRYRRADVPGSPWLPVDGTAQVASPSVTLNVIETRAVLVP